MAVILLETIQYKQVSFEIRNTDESLETLFYIRFLNRQMVI